MKNEKKTGMSRREFTGIAAAFGATAAFGASPAAWSAGRKQRIAVVGTGSRGQGFYVRHIEEKYLKEVDIVGFCDLNIGRVKLAQRVSKERTGRDIKGYKHTDFDKMIAEQKPDVVIVTTKDSEHSTYIIRAMELGCDVITEKPMTTDADKCQKIIDTQKKSGKTCTVTFNYRYSPSRTQIKDILMNGDIGDVQSVDFHWMLNTYHGANYFRRWHANKENSGGLMVHKSTHHFDLMNFWLAAVPTSVYAKGKKEYYTPKMAKRMGLSGPHERCMTCPEAKKCAFYIDLAADKKLKELYLDNEHHDGYIRDRCVFRPGIDIEDNMNCVVTYDNGVNMSYTLNAFNSWEGYTIVFNGTKGRLEHRTLEKLWIDGEGEEPGGIAKGDTTTIVYPLRGPAVHHDVWHGSGSHGGGDTVMLDELFAESVPEDKYQRAADQRAGAYSILTGVAANESMRTGKSIDVADLVKRIGYPDYSEHPSSDTPIPMPGEED